MTVDPKTKADANRATRLAEIRTRNWCGGRMAVCADPTSENCICEQELEAADAKA